MGAPMMEGVQALVVESGYRYREPVLRGVRLQAGPGELVLVVGRSGSGKTTLLLTITGVIVNLLGGYARGSVRLASVDPLAPEGFRGVPRLVGVVLQDPDKQISLLTPLDETAFVLENLGLPREEAEARALRALERFGLSGKALVDSAVLSGGEKRRLTFAAALVHDPPILLLDEPTASLDPWGVAEVRRLVRDALGEGRTVLVIEHKARYFLDMADRVVALRAGEAAGSWSPPPGPRVLSQLGADVHEPRIVERRTEPGRVVASLQGVSACISGRRILRGVDLEVRSGEVLAVAGPNGSGKTTLLRVLAGLLKPCEGEARLAGGWRPFLVTQLPDYMFMFNTVEKELRYSAERGLGREELERVLAEEPWLRGALARSPYKLSHGQRRWLGLSIARLHGHRLLLLDEPSTGLDAELYGRLCRYIREHAGRGGAVVMSTHDPRLVGECSDRAVRMEDGRLWEVDRARLVREMEHAWRAA